jgi:PAS domain S-box-containing protein
MFVELTREGVDVAVSRLLDESGSILFDLFWNPIIGMLVAQNDRFVFVNQRLADMFGYSREKLCRRYLRAPYIFAPELNLTVSQVAS